MNSEVLQKLQIKDNRVPIMKLFESLCIVLSVSLHGSCLAQNSVSDEDARFRLVDGLAYLDSCYSVKKTYKVPKSIDYDGKQYPVVGIWEEACTWNEHRPEYFPEKIILSNGIRIIGRKAFEDADCKKIHIPNSVVEIGEGAFSGIEATQIKLPDNITVIKDYTFDFTDLEKIHLPKNLHYIYLSAFEDCDWLEHIRLPKYVMVIQDRAFYGCSSLKRIHIPEYVAVIGEKAFGNCEDLSRITVSKRNLTFDSRDNCNAVIRTATDELVVGGNKTSIPNTVKRIGPHAFAGRQIEHIDIPNSVTYIGKGAFSDCYELVSITLPDCIEEINYGTFFGCGKLTDIHLPQSLKKIDDYAFSFVSSSSITIPCNVDSIGNSAFSNCDSLREIHIENPIPIFVGDEAFFRTPVDSIVLYVPKGSKQQYKSHPQWGQFVNIKESND